MSNLKPNIAITTRNYFANDDKDFFHENMSYVEYIKAAGGQPFLIPFVDTLTEAKLIASQMDGLLLTGGQDVDPQFYHEKNLYSKQINTLCDQSDFYLYQAFKEAHKPILGICRGLQVIAVYEHTHLIQDLPILKQVEHNQDTSSPTLLKSQPFHTNLFEKDTLCHTVFGDSYAVNSFHHQALADVPLHFKLSSYATDNTIEAIERIDTNHWIVAVQWHPERMMNDEKSLTLAKLFIENSLRKTA